ncbi:MAG: hypothetical protein QW369_02570 [Desulfurococcaceae archaeon]
MKSAGIPLMQLYSWASPLSSLRLSSGLMNSYSTSIHPLEPSLRSTNIAGFPRTQVNTIA